MHFKEQDFRSISNIKFWSFRAFQVVFDTTQNHRIWAILCLRRPLLTWAYDARRGRAHLCEMETETCTSKRVGKKHKGTFIPVFVRWKIETNATCISAVRRSPILVIRFVCLCVAARLLSSWKRVQYDRVIEKTTITPLRFLYLGFIIRRLSIGHFKNR